MNPEAAGFHLQPMFTTLSLLPYKPWKHEQESELEGADTLFLNAMPIICWVWSVCLCNLIDKAFGNVGWK